MNFATPNEAAQFLGGRVSAVTIRRGAQSGKYPHIKIGKHILVDLDVLAPMVEAESRRCESVNTTALSQATGLTPSAIRRGVEEGWLPATRNGKHLRFCLEDVEKALVKRMNECSNT